MRTAAVRGEVEPKEVCFIGHIDETGLTPREAAAVGLAERIARDPHEVDDDFFAEVRKHFSDEEIVEMVFATSIFNWGNKFNITMHMDAAENLPIMWQIWLLICFTSTSAYYPSQTVFES